MRFTIIRQTNCALFARSSFDIPSRCTETDQHRHVDHGVPGLLKSTCDIAANRPHRTVLHWANLIRLHYWCRSHLLRLWRNHWQMKCLCYPAWECTRAILSRNATRQLAQITGTASQCKPALSNGKSNSYVTSLLNMAGLADAWRAV